MEETLICECEKKKVNIIFTISFPLDLFYYFVQLLFLVYLIKFAQFLFLTMTHIFSLIFIIIFNFHQYI